MLRDAGPGDRLAAQELHQRCSPGTLAQRYPDGWGEADSYLPHLLDPRHGHTVAAETAGGVWVGVGHLLRDGEEPEEEAEAEVTLLVADAWQRRGIGTALLRRLLGLASRQGCQEVYAVTRPGHGGMIAALRGTGLPLYCEPSDDTLVVTLRLAGAPIGAAGSRRPGCCTYRPAEPRDPRKAL